MHISIKFLCRACTVCSCYGMKSSSFFTCKWCVNMVKSDFSSLVVVVQYKIVVQFYFVLAVWFNFYMLLSLEKTIIIREITSVSVGCVCVCVCLISAFFRLFNSSSMPYTLKGHAKTQATNHIMLELFHVYMLDSFIRYTVQM